MGAKAAGQLAKRHCMVVHAYYPVGETRVQREALALLAAGYEVDVLCLRDRGERAVDTEEGVNIYRLPMKRYKGLGLPGQLIEYLAFFMLAFFKLLSLYPKRSYGAVQVHNLPDFLIFCAIYPKLCGAKLILDLHDLMPEFFAAKTEGDMNSLAVRVVTWQEQLSCRFADHVITVTDVWKETLIQRGVPEHKVSVVMNVADGRIFHRLPETRLASANGDHFNLIYHGTFTHRYGVDLIVQAVDKVRQEVPNIQAILIGDGEYREDLLRLTQELGVESHVDLSRQLIPAIELPPLIRQAHVGIVPNRSNIFTDGLLPTKLMEYVALGTPVIAAQTPTINAYFDETMVQFFKPGDVDDLAKCIIALSQDRQCLNQFANNANRFNEKYRWDRVAADYVATVDGLNGR
jgi:glycosyltransferase involved in cell wall biosynthesis